MSEAPALRLQILAAGLEENVFEIVKDRVLNADLKQITTASEFENLIENLSPGQFHLFLCGPALGEIQPAELAQAFKTMGGGAPVHYAPLQRNGVDFKLMQKHGFDEVYVLPFEEGLFGRMLRNCEREITGLAKVHYHSVPIMEFDEDSTLDFSVSIFLPVNNKYVKMFKPGHRISNEQIEKWKKHQMRSLNVDESELDKFVGWSATRLRELGKYSEHSYSAKQKLQGTVRGMFRQLIASEDVNFDGGKNLLENAQQIVAEFTASRPAHNLYQQLVMIQGPDDDIYAHCGRVSTLGALLSLGTGIGQPQDLAIAGLFHDIGKTRLDPKLLLRPFDELSDEDKAEFWRYPELSLGILQDKKMGVNPRVRSMILQQGERADGTGYPHELPEHKVELDVFLLMVANKLDLMMQVREGFARPKLEDVLASKELADGISTKVMDAVLALLNFESKAA